MLENTVLLTDNLRNCLYLILRFQYNQDSTCIHCMYLLNLPFYVYYLVPQPGGDRGRAIPAPSDHHASRSRALKGTSGVRRENASRATWYSRLAR